MNWQTVILCIAAMGFVSYAFNQIRIWRIETKKIKSEEKLLEKRLEHELAVMEKRHQHEKVAKEYDYKNKLLEKVEKFTPDKSLQEKIVEKTLEK